MSDLICEYCNKKYSTKGNCTKHKLKCTIRLQQENAQDKKQKEYDENIKKIQK